MGISFNGKGRWFPLSFRGWTEVQSLALTFNWEPLGTRPGPGSVRSYRRSLRRAGKSPAAVERAIAKYRRDWTGGYGSNDGQWVTARDAAGLAHALSTALAAVTDLFDTGGSRTKYRSELGVAIEEELKSFSDLDSRELLMTLIAFCEAGGFTID